MVATFEFVSNGLVANVSVQTDPQLLPSGPALRALPPLAPAADRVRWLRFSYRLPTDAKVARVQVWRELRRLDAVRLGQAMWATRVGVDGEDPLATAHHIVARAGGTCTCEEVDAGMGDQPGDTALLAVCEHRWDALFNDADRLHVQLLDGLGSPLDTTMTSPFPDALAVEVEHLRVAFHELRATSILPTDSGRRLQRRIIEIEALTPAPTAQELDPKEPGVRYRVTGSRSRWALHDGSVLVVTPIDPWPTLGWERAFNGFEDTAYLPSPTRPRLEQGAFSFRCLPDEQHAALTAIDRRLAVVTAALP